MNAMFRFIARMTVRARVRVTSDPSGLSMVEGKRRAPQYLIILPEGNPAPATAERCAFRTDYAELDKDI